MLVPLKLFSVSTLFINARNRSVAPEHWPLVVALVALKAAVSDANRDIQRDIYDLAEKKSTAQFLAGLNTRHGPQPPVYPSTIEVTYVAAMKKADVDAQVAGLERDIDRLQDRLDLFNHERRVEVATRTLELAS